MSVIPCPYCKDPSLLRTDFTSSPARRKNMSASSEGQFWKKSLQDSARIPFEVPVWREGNQEFYALSPSLFAEEKKARIPWKSFRIEMLGLEFLEEPPQPPSPLFETRSYQSYTATTTIGEDIGDWSVNRGPEPKRWVVWCACRIIHKDSGLRVLVHWWKGHEWQFEVEGYNFELSPPTAVLMKALGFFSIGRGKPDEHFRTKREFMRALNAYIARPEMKSRFEEKQYPTEAEVAAALCNDPKFNEATLRRWLNRWWKGKPWKEIIEALLISRYGDSESQSKNQILNKLNEGRKVIEQGGEKYEIILKL